MWQYIHTDELYHYGVLGMKWGQRRRGYISTGQSIRNARKAYKNASVNKGKAARESMARDKVYNKNLKNSRISKDSRKVTKLRKRPVDELSDQELQRINKRLEMESRYKDLSSKSSKRNIGKNVVQAVIATGTTIAALETAAKTYKRVGEFAVNKFSKK